LRIGNILNKNYDVFYSIINKDDHAIIKEKIQNAYIKKENYNLKYVLPYEIDKSIYVSSFGVFFPVNGFYLNGYFPTKLGEFLSNGIPVITCPINKDVDSIIRNNKIGIIIDNTEMNNNNILREIENILLIDNLSDKCRAVAEKFFNIENAIKIYQRIYNK
jgi:glycosyltransferase involved in cell wall biosynthesis